MKLMALAMRYVIRASNRLDKRLFRRSPPEIKEIEIKHIKSKPKPKKKKASPLDWNEVEGEVSDTDSDEEPATQVSESVPDDEDELSDGGEWITPDNVDKFLSEDTTKPSTESERTIFPVRFSTSDYAM